MHIITKQTGMLLVLLSILIALSVQVQYSEAQDTDAATSLWNMHTYMWSERSKLWARTACTMPIGGIGVQAKPCNGEDDCTVAVCRNTASSTSSSDHWPSIVTYDHEGTGHIKGRAWSPVLGVIFFDQAEFPATACYGLTGESRQPRVVRVDPGLNATIDRTDSIVTVTQGVAVTGTVVIVGCAYVPLLRDYILFSPVGGDINTPQGWSGVQIQTVEASSERETFNADSDFIADAYDPSVNYPYIQLFGCGQSKKNGRWAFGPNQGSNTTDNCLPASVNTALKKEVKNTAIGYVGAAGEVSVSPETTNARVGQQVSFLATCPPGYTRALSLDIFGEKDSLNKLIAYQKGEVEESALPDPVRTTDLTKQSSGGFFSSLYRYIERLFVSIAALRVTCVDGSTYSIFSGERTGFSRGVTSEALFLHTFKGVPETIVEGGFVALTTKISNNGNPNTNGGFCTIVNKTTKESIACFQPQSTQSATTLVSNEVVVRDTVFELACRFDDSDPGEDVDRYLGRNFCNEDTTTSAFATWKTVRQKEVVIKVLPSRVRERKIVESVVAPTLSKETDGSIKVQIDQGGSSDEKPFEVRLYYLDETGKKVILPTNPDKHIAFFKKEEDLDLKEEDKKVCLGEDKTKRTGGSLFEKCIGEKRFGAKRKNTGKKDIGVVGNKVKIESTGLSGKVIVAELLTEYGVRSQKIVYRTDGRSDPRVNRSPRIILPLPDRVSNVVTKEWTIDLSTHFTDEGNMEFEYTIGSGTPTVTAKIDQLTAILTLTVAGGQGSRDVVIKATDEDGLFSTATFKVTQNFDSSNTAPTVKKALENRTTTSETKTWSTIRLSDYFSDVETQNLTYTYTIAAGSPTVAVTIISGVMTVKVSGANGSRNVTVTATDVGGLTASSNFRVGKNYNAKPTVKKVLEDRTTTKTTETWNNIILSDYFSDAETLNLTYTYTVGSGTPTVTVTITNGAMKVVVSGANGSRNVTVKATDAKGKFVTDTFRVKRDYNTAPTLTKEFPDRTTTEKSAEWENIGLRGFFNDAEGSLTITSAVSSDATTTITATIIANLFLTINVSGTNGTGQVTITATDNKGLSVSDTFTVTRNYAGNAPRITKAIPNFTGAGRFLLKTFSLYDHFRDAEGLAEGITFTIEVEAQVGARDSLDATLLPTNELQIIAFNFSSGVSRKVTVTAKNADGQISTSFTVSH